MPALRAASISVIRHVAPHNQVLTTPVVTSAVAQQTLNTAAAGFWSFAVPFVLGGFFFTTVVSYIGAVYAFGADNVRRARNELFVVARRVLAVLRSTILASYAALTDDSKKWTEAIAELRRGFSRAKEVAAEGAEAISLQRDLYAAAVGIPGLPLQQYIVDRLYANRRFLAAALEEALGSALSEVQNKRIKKLTLKKFEAGTVPPRLRSARAYDVEDALAFDIETRWESELAFEIEMVATGLVGARVPVTCRRLRFEGPVRVIATPLLSSPPGFGALLVSLPSPPKIGLDVRVAGGEITKLPWLRDEIENALQEAIGEALLWPRRVVVPSTKAPAPSAETPILSKQELKALEDGDDPLLRAEQSLAQSPAVSAIAKERRPDPSDAKGVRGLLNILVRQSEMETKKVL